MPLVTYHGYTLHALHVLTVKGAHFVPRWVHAATETGTLYIAGGYTTAAMRPDDETPAIWLNDVFEFCTATQTWRQLQRKDGKVHTPSHLFRPRLSHVQSPCLRCYDVVRT
jgi:hypothetical protein